MKILEKLTILYVENKKECLDKYLAFLERHCERLYLAYDGKEAYDIYIARDPHIVIMDLHLSRFNSTNLAKKIRERGDYNTLLIALTEHADKNMLLDIIDLNFSSYIVKPVNITELLSTLLKISKKIESGKMIYLEYDCSWDSSTNTLFYNNEQIILTKREQKLFELLIQKNGLPCSDDEIFFYVWEDDFDKTITNASIRTLIKNLRKKIPKELIVNQYAVGYKINL